jgi:hypothetical protein
MQYGKFLYQYRKVRAHGGLAASKPNSVYPKVAHANACDASKLFIRQYLIARKPLHSLFRHAIRAAEIAAIGNRNAQVANSAPVWVDQIHTISLRFTPFKHLAQ